MTRAADDFMVSECMSDSVPHSLSSSKTASLRRLLQSPTLEFLMEAHSGMSARIVEEAGFKAIWASGLGMSANLGVRDNNEASWTQVVDTVEFMADATSIPILLDGDTGYGNFNNMRRLVRKLESRGVAGVCIEDKVFPKANSFIGGERQPLADVEEFCGKIQAGKDTQRDPDFCILARVEALIAGWGLDEALRRADAYREAGADAILIHSKRPDPEEVLAFAGAWGRRLPLVIVPTKYYSTPTEVFREAGISVVIWANHLIRAAVSAMASVAREVRATASVADVEDRIASIDEIFRLQGAEELAEAERRYLASMRGDAAAVVLAATRGEGLERVTEDRPKVMLPIGGSSLLRRLVDELKRQHVNHITVVAGYKASAIDVAGIRVVHNPRYMHSGELASLDCARDLIGENTVVIYGDLLFRSYILQDLIETPAEVLAVVDSALPPAHGRDYHDLAYCSRPDERALFRQDVNLLKVCSRPEPEAPPPSGRWIGMLRVHGRGRSWLLEALDRVRDRPDFDALSIPDLLNAMIEAQRPVKVLYVHGHWLDVNGMEDLGRAADFTHGAPSYSSGGA